MWVRGLKLRSIYAKHIESLSHPMWVRGLKRCVMLNTLHRKHVAPHVGAWIETQDAYDQR